MGKGLNKECKFFLLQYAYEHLKFERLEFKTDFLNSCKKSLEKISVKEEGTLRNYTLMHDGRRRDTGYYCILADEWQQERKFFFSKDY